MSMPLNKPAYSKLIAEDIEWLNAQPRSLERDHIEQVLRSSDRNYLGGGEWQAVTSRRQAISEPSPVMSEAVATLVVVEDDSSQYGKTAHVPLDERCMSVPIGEHQLYTQPTPTTAQPTDERDARIAELEGLVVEVAQWCEAEVKMFTNKGHWQERAARLRAAIKPAKPLSECHNMPFDRD